jgi:hypothetical protein
VSTVDQIERLIERANGKPTEFREPYMAGYDCGLNGANEKNCHFGWFATQAHTTAWEHGKADGERDRGEP